MPIMRVGGKRLRVAGKTARAETCCCNPPCTCPAGLPTSYLVTGHMKVIDATDSSVICETDFSPVVTASGFPCDWRNFNVPLCEDFPDTTFELAQDTEAGVCGWRLLIFTPENGQSFRAGGANPTGAYPNITAASAFRIMTITSIVVS